MAEIVIFVHGTYDQCVVKKNTAAWYSKNNSTYKDGLMQYAPENLESNALDTKSVALKRRFGEDDDIFDRLTAISALTGVAVANIYVFGWSGLCETAARELGGYRLAIVLNEIKCRGYTTPSKLITIEQGANVSIITHSHGGNVLGHALMYFEANDKIINKAYLFACPFFTSIRNNINKRSNSQLNAKTMNDRIANQNHIDGENLWIRSDGGVSKVKEMVYSFFSPYDQIQSKGAGGMHAGAVRSELIVIGDINQFENHSITPNNDKGMNATYYNKTDIRSELTIGASVGKSHTDLNHAAAYVAAKAVISS